MTVRGELTFTDRLLACGLSLAVALFAFWDGSLCDFPLELSDALSVAAGLRPPEREFPLLWHRLAEFLIDRAGLARAIEILFLLGPISLGLLAAATYRLMIACLPEVLRFNGNARGWGRWLSRWVVVLGTLLFVGSDPVWRVGRFFSPEMLLLLMTVAAVFSAVMVFERSSVAAVFFTGIFSGALAAESPVGFLPPVFLALQFLFRDFCPVGAELPIIANPLVQKISLRRMVLLFVCCWAAVVAADFSFYRLRGGVGADAGAVLGFLRMLGNYLPVVRGAMSPFGWIIVAMAVVFPVVFSVMRIGRAGDTRHFLPMRYGFFFLVAGIFSIAQSSGFSACRFWQWMSDPEPVASRYLLALCMLGTSLTAFFSLCVLAVDVYLRNYQRLAIEEFGPDPGSLPAVFRLIRTLRLSVRFWRPVLLVPLPLAVTAMVVWGRIDAAGRNTAAIIGDFVRHTADECGDAPLLFTDGSLDSAVELAAALDGRRLKALSMMSGSSPYEVAVRTSAVTNAEDRVRLSIGAADALRTWVRENSPNATNLALQIGFELWRHDRRPMPECGGFVARTAGFRPGEAQKGADAARRLAERILELCADEDALQAVPASLRSLLSFVQWRLSRMCRMRANAADARAETGISEREHELADRLDAANPQWRRLQDAMDGFARGRGTRLTPREGLSLGLSRADFRMARSYARQVLAADAADMRANFAMGMSYLAEQQYGRAEHFLKLARNQAPDEPAVLNNLAVVLLRLDRFDEAETNAVRALKAFPASPEIKETLRTIRKAKTERKML